MHTQIGIPDTCILPTYTLCVLQTPHAFSVTSSATSSILTGMDVDMKLIHSWLLCVWSCCPEH